MQKEWESGKTQANVHSDFPFSNNTETPAEIFQQGFLLYQESDLVNIVS